jgi:hypothetical protein
VVCGRAVGAGSHALKAASGCQRPAHPESRPAFNLFCPALPRLPRPACPCSPCRSAGHITTWAGKGSDPDKTFADLLTAKTAADEARFEVARRFTEVGWVGRGRGRGKDGRCWMGRWPALCRRVRWDVGWLSRLLAGG